MSSLFGSRPAASGGNLFDRITPANQAQQSTGPSLFGGSTTSTAQPQQTSAPSLFGGSTATNQAQQSSSGGGGALQFGTSIANSQPQQTSGSNLFQAGASIFGPQAPNNESILGQQQPFQRPADAGALFSSRTAQPGEPDPQPAYFQSLLERGKKRQQEGQLTPFGGLPQLQLGLADISRKVRKIGVGGPSAAAARAGDARAHYLLSASGISTTQALLDIEELSRQPTLSQSRVINSSGVKETLAKQYDDSFLELIENSRKRVQADFDRMIDENLHDVDWSGHRQRIYEHFGLRKPADYGGGNSANVSFGNKSVQRTRSGHLGASGTRSTYGMSHLSKSVIGNVGSAAARRSVFADVAERLPADGLRPAPEDRVLRLKQDKYAEKVQELNAARLQEKLYPLLHRFADVEREPSNDDTSMLVFAYNALVQIVGERPAEAARSDPGVVKPRQFVNDYLEENERSPASMALRRSITDGSRKYLEQHYLNMADGVVAKNPREAVVGGIPTVINKIKGFVRVKAAKKELGPDFELLQVINGDYCWALLYYLFRCGLYEDALEYIEQNAVPFRQIDRSFPNYLRHYVGSPEKRLSPEQQARIDNEYSQRSRLAPENSIDPYRMMCYKIIGRCDLQRRNFPDSIVGVTDHFDWLWLQFTIAREYDPTEESQQNAFGLLELRRAIKEIGDRHFGPGTDLVGAPMLHFFMQILSGQFEAAVSNLYPHHYVSATHFAIALDYYGLLRVSNIDNSDDLLSYTTTEMPQLAFGSMVGLYTRDFRTANAAAAADYLCLICLNSDIPGAMGKNYRDLCYQAMTELILETRDYAQLLGDIRDDGRRIRGAIEQRLKLINLENEQEFLKHITLVAARAAEQQGRTSDAALLFHLAEDYVRVLQVCNNTMSLFLTTDLGSQPLRLETLKPRVPADANGGVQNAYSSLSLSAIDDPFQLARAFRDLYSSSAMYFDKFGKDTSPDTCNVLLRLAEARSQVEQGKWASAIDNIRVSSIIPTDANNNMSAIRQKVRDFEAMPQVLARTIGHVMLWTVVSCTEEVKRLKQGEFETVQRQQVIASLVAIANDLMVFAGMIKYKLPQSTMEVIAKAGQELGVY